MKIIITFKKKIILNKKLQNMAQNLIKFNLKIKKLNFYLHK